MIEKKKLYNIANIIEESRFGGPQKRIINVASSISSEFKTTIFLSKENSDFFVKNLKENNLKYELLPITTLTKNFLMLLKYIIFFIPEVIIIKQKLNKNNYDLIHVSGGIWQFKSLISAKLNKKKTIWHLNDAKMPLLIRLIFYTLSFLPDAYICSSKRTMNYYKKFMINKKTPIYIVNAPVSSNIFNLKYKFNTNLTNKEKNTIKIVTVANISPIKGLELLITTATKLHKKNIDYQFDIFGKISNNQKNYFKKLTKNIDHLKINFRGFNENIIKEYPDFDIYLCSSHSESSPTSVWEAMSMGKIIISTDVGDLKEIFSELNFNYIVSRDPDEVYKKILFIKNNFYNLIKYAHKNRDYIFKNNEISIISNLQQKIYKKVICNE